MAPEQLGGARSRAQTDVYAAAIVLWEALTGKRLFEGENEGQILAKVLGGVVDPPSTLAPELPAGARRRRPARARRAIRRTRYPTARELALALERCVGIASPTEVGEWVEAVAHGALAKRAEAIAEIESSSANLSAQELTATAPLPNDIPSQPSGVRAQADPPIPQASQLSSISLSRETSPAKPKRGLLVAAIATLAALVGVLIIVLLSMKTRTEVKPTATESPTVSVAPAVTVTATAAAASTVAVAATTTPPASTTPPAVTTSPPIKHGHGGTTSTQAVTAPPPPATTAPKNCDPPYTLDAKGHKIWKRECM